MIPILPEENNTTFLSHFIQQLKENHVNELYIDCFPVGIYGELNGLTKQLLNVKVNLIARLIHWPNYQRLIKVDNQFSSVLYVEELAEQQLDYYHQIGASVKPLTLIPFLDNNQKIDALALETSLTNASITGSLITDFSVKSVERPYCLFVHSGSENEMAQLLDYGIQKLRFNKLNYTLVLASPWPIPAQFKGMKIRAIQCYPIIHWLMDAAIIVSAAGFNLMNEVSQLKATHWVLPFERKYDDQFSRLANKKCIEKTIDNSK